VNIAVIGGHSCGEEIYQLAYETGRLIAQEGWILVCGGRGGVMEAACKGAKEEGGLTVGILPGSDPAEANDYVEVKIPTGLGYARNALVVRAAEVAIAIDGREGTLSEIAFSLCESKTVLGLKTWDIDGVVEIGSPADAINYIKENYA